MAPKSVCYLSGRWPPEFCGIGDYTYNLASALGTLKYKVHILTRGNQLHTPPHTHIYNIKGTWRGLSTVRGFREIQKVNPNILHVQWETYSFQQSWILPWLLQSTKIPLVITLHEIFFKNALHKVRDLSWFKNARHLIVNDQLSLSKLNQLTELAHIPKSVIGVGSNIPKQFDSQKSLNPNDIIISYFGFLNAVKDLSTVMQGLALLPHKNWTLRLIGAFNEHNLNEIKSQAQYLEIQSHLDIHSNVHQAQVSQLLAESTICILPFSDGASPRRGSLQACLLHEKPVITTQPKVSEPLFQHGSNLWLLKELSKDEVYNAVLQLSENADLYKKLVQGSKILAQSYDWEQIAIRHDAIYQNISI